MASVGEGAAAAAMAHLNAEGEDAKLPPDIQGLGKSKEEKQVSA
jgi:hypothetical protein